MSRYAITHAALEDLDEIASYIARDSPVAADRMMDAMFEAFGALAERPGIGHGRPDLTNQRLKFWTVVGRYMVVYRERAKSIQILRVFAAGRDVTTILKK